MCPCVLVSVYLCILLAGLAGYLSIYQELMRQQFGDDFYAAEDEDLQLNDDEVSSFSTIPSRDTYYPLPHPCLCLPTLVFSALACHPSQSPSSVSLRLVIESR